MRLDKNPSVFKASIEETARYFDIDPVYVEKDYWIYLLLKEIFSNDNDFVFKGGTSLSKCFHLIDRFSEDIDISYIPSYASLNRNQREKRYRSISNAISNVGLTISNKDDLRRGRYFNRFICPYNSFYNNGPIGNTVIVELAAQSPCYPHLIKSLQSFIGEYFIKTNQPKRVDDYGLEPINVFVQALERTLVDKTFAICDYYLINKVERNSRHIYDIHKILPNIELNDSLIKLFKEIYDLRYPLVVCKSAKDGVKLHVILEDIIKNRFFESDYRNLTNYLLYEVVKYEDCLKTLNQLNAFLKDNDL